MAGPSIQRSAPAEERARLVMRRLKKAYPDARVALNFSNAFECVVATILSAQSTDARVNLVTKDLFQKYRRPQDFLAVPEEELQKDIQSTGFFRQKTRSLRGMSQKLLDDFSGEVPSTIAELITLPGVARKTANIVQACCYPEAMRSDADARIAVDTHVGRVAVRLGFVDVHSKEAEKIERRLMELIPKKDWRKVTELFIEHGRRVCDAKKPRCAECPIEPLCPSSQEAALPDLYRITAKPRTRKAAPK